MKANQKAKCSLLLSVLLIAVMIVVLGANAFAAQSNAVSKDGLTAQLFTDKDSYNANEQITVTVRVDNQSGTEAAIQTSVNVPESVKLVGSTSYAAVLSNGSTWTTPSTGAGEGGDVETGDQMPWLWIVLAISSFAVLLVYGKNRKALLCVLLCMSMIGGLVAPAASAQAADLSGQITLSCTIQVDGKDEEVSAVVSYTIFDGGESTEPSEEPTEPSEEPTEPSAEPTEPSAEPTEPSAEPTEPSAEPTEPSV